MAAPENSLANATQTKRLSQNRATKRRNLVPYVGVLCVYIAFYLLFFSPALIHSLILAPGDGINTFYPALIRHWSLWTDQMYSGYPVFAAPQYFTWSPLRLFGHHYNAAVISAYVIASYTAFGYSQLVTKSWPGALVAGFIYGAGGFMMSHLGHLSIIHVAAWIPSLFLGGELLARGGEWQSGSLISIGTALSFLGGHPQPWVYGLITFTIYMVWRGIAGCKDDVVHGWRLTIYAGLYAAVGVLIVAVQLWPMHELTEHTVRSGWTFQDFSTYEMPPLFLFHGLFPNLFGNISGYYHYFFSVYPAEIGFYTGVTALVLAVTAVVGSKPKTITSFWCVMALLALIYSLGSATPLGKLAFQIPVINQFRASGRAVMIFDLAVGTLAGIGVAHLEGKFKSSARRRTIGLAACAIGFAVATAAVIVEYPHLSAVAKSRSVTLPSVIDNAAVWLPCMFALFALAACTWCCLTENRKSFVIWALVLIAVVDVSSYGWFCEWQTRSIPSTEVRVAPQWRSIIESSGRNYGRVMALGGAYGPLTPAEPSLNLASGIPSAGGHSPLVLNRYASLTNIHEMGAFWGSVPGPVSPLWQLLGVRWIFQTTTPDPAIPVQTNMPVTAILGSGCGDDSPRQGLSVGLPRNMYIKAIKIVSTLHCSTDVSQGSPVLRISVGRSASPVFMRAGVDTSEWAADRPDLREQFKHSVARVANSVETPQGYALHWYGATLDLDAPVEGDRLLFHSLLPAGTDIEIRKVTVISRGGRTTNIPLIGAVYSADMGWRKILPPPGVGFAARNTKYLGRAWLVYQGITLGDAAALTAIHSGTLPNGHRFMPGQAALVKQPITNLPTTPAGGSGHVNAIRLSADAWNIDVRSTRRALLVMSQVDYPGWHATVNGAPTPIVRVDYALQGIPIPAGDSIVKLRFLPMSVLIGGGLSVLGILLLLVVCTSPLKARALPHVRLR